METLTVYTCIVGGKDDLKMNQNFSDSKFVAFIDPFTNSNLGMWELRPASRLFVDDRRNARIHKVLSHQYIDTEYSLWMDGNYFLVCPASSFLKFLDGFDIAVFPHTQRDCIYDEIEACIKLSKDDHDILRKQDEKYRKDSYKVHSGLFESGLIVRRHTKKVEEFNNAWWSEICSFSKRDQVSLPYIAKKVRLPINIIPIGFQKNSPRIKHLIDG